MLTLSSFATRLQMQEVLPDSSRLIFLAGIPVFHNDGFEMGELAPWRHQPSGSTTGGEFGGLLGAKVIWHEKKGREKALA